MPSVAVNTGMQPIVAILKSQMKTRMYGATGRFFLY